MRQVLRPGALGRPRGIGWRGRWERRSGWGIHVTPWLIHVNVWQIPLKCCEVISLQLIKMNEKKKKKNASKFGKLSSGHRTGKGTISKVKRQPSDWEKTIANEATDKGLTSNSSSSVFLSIPKKGNDKEVQTTTPLHSFNIN